MFRSVIRLRKPPPEVIGDPEAPRQKPIASNVDPPLDWSVKETKKDDQRSPTFN